MISTQNLTAQDEQAFFEERIRPLFIQHCVECHSDVDSQGGLSLESAEGWKDRKVIEPGSPESSLLWKAVKRDDPEFVMPPVETGKSLSAREIDDLKHWIKSGAFDPRTKRDTPVGPKRRPRTFVITEHDRSHWAYQPVVREPASFRDDDRGSSQVHPIDRRIRYQLDQMGVKPNPRATPRELVRRAFFDLWGLPPTFEDVVAFEQQPTEKAWTQLIDRLLDSPHYGERWGRHWLDTVRYAETNGYERDGPKPHVWRYRDYVIRSFNQDKPFDRFLTEQLAGDLLIEHDQSYSTPESDRWGDAIIATGFYRLHVWDDEPDDTEAAELDDLDDIIVTTSISMLGLTIGCARCHDHKFDPISQQDYYALLDLLRDIDPYGLSKKGGGGRGTGNIERYLAEPSKMASWEATKSVEVAALADKLLSISNEKRASVEKELEVLRNKKPPFDAALTILPPLKRKPTNVLYRGDYQNPRQSVTGGIPSLFSHYSETTQSQGDNPPVRNRLDFARWITQPTHPLTARVAVNRVWQKHFGKGIAETTDDFGFTGLAPSNRELLDWLASELIRNGWSMKTLHRTIMHSEAYRASSHFGDNPAHGDPDNRYFWRQNLRRIEAEAIRDSFLAFSDSLNEKRDGTSVVPSLSDEIRTTANPVSIQNWKASPEEEQNCRSVFLVVKRSLKDPLLESFDFVNSHSPVGVRTVTTTGPQALMLLNDRFVTTQSQRLIQRLTPDKLQLDRLWQIILQRNPLPSERLAAERFLSQFEDPTKAWTSLCRALLNASETIYVD